MILSRLLHAPAVLCCWLRGHAPRQRNGVKIVWEEDGTVASRCHTCGTQITKNFHTGAWVRRRLRQ